MGTSRNDLRNERRLRQLRELPYQPSENRADKIVILSVLVFVVLVLGLVWVAVSSPML